MSTENEGAAAATPPAEPTSNPTEASGEQHSYTGSFPEQALSLDLISEDRGLQARVKLNEDHVENNLMPAVQKGLKRANEPAVVFHERVKVPPEKEGGKEKEEDRYWLADGFQWLEAHRRLGKRKMTVQVREGTRLDALKYAVGANALHGASRTTADKERAVTLCLEDENLRGMSTKYLAKLCQVSEGLTKKVREEWEKEHKVTSGTRTGADKRVRKKNITRPNAVERAAQKAIVETAGKIATAKDPEKLSAPEAGKTRPRGIKDAIGREVPEILAHVFHGNVKIDGVVMILRNAMAQIDLLRSAGVLPYLAKSFDSAIDGAISDLVYAKPAVVCASCGGEGCKECRIGDHSVGFLSSGAYAGLSKSEKAAFTKAAEEAEDGDGLGEEVTLEGAAA